MKIVAKYAILVEQEISLDLPPRFTEEGLQRQINLITQEAQASLARSVKHLYTIRDAKPGRKVTVELPTFMQPKTQSVGPDVTVAPLAASGTAAEAPSPGGAAAPEERNRTSPHQSAPASGAGSLFESIAEQ